MQEEDAHIRPRNIVVCSDGTGQSYAGQESNVLRLFELVLKHSSRQIACYDPGVGTLPSAARTSIGRTVRHATQLAFGIGVMDNVTELYAYLMRRYEPRDEIFLFGFSRGAFTVRALAGMIRTCGLLRRDDEHLLSYAAGLYETSEHRIARTRRLKGLPARIPNGPGSIDHAMFDDEARRFKEQLSRERHIRFMGLWDTVKAYGWIVPQSFPALRHNPSVRAVRHAVSLDERRSSFQVTGWGDRHPDVKEVWFRGDHSDIGGGHIDRSLLADITLAWMLGEATEAGLILDPRSEVDVENLVERARSGALNESHDLRHGFFRVLDWAPRLELDNSEYPPRRRFRCWPTGTRRPLQHAENAAVLVHDSVPPVTSPQAGIEVVKSREIRWPTPPQIDADHVTEAR
jgi:uncharacterized protein (DUF2235 family)